jgi:hypothetical protein
MSDFACENLTVNGNETIAGNVGIGTISPTVPLHLYKSSGGVAALIESSDSGITLLKLKNSTGSGNFEFGRYTNKLGWYSDSTHSQVLTIDNSNGNIGVGTDSPTAKLTIEGSGGAANQNTLQVRYTNSENYAGNLTYSHLQLGENGTNYIVAGNTTAGGRLQIVVNNTNNLVGTTTAPNGTIAMTILASGNVGIGTTNPGVKLDVAGEIRSTDGQLVTGTAGSNNTHSRIQLNPVISGQAVFWIDNENNGLLRLSNGSTPNNEHPMVLDNDGNVGIGTTDPQYKLDVAGDARFSGSISAANSVKVQESGWLYVSSSTSVGFAHGLGRFPFGVMVLYAQSPSSTPAQVCGPTNDDSKGAFVYVDNQNVHVFARQYVGVANDQWQTSGYYKIVVWGQQAPGGID